jgi:hypothetical protein
MSYNYTTYPDTLGNISISGANASTASIYNWASSGTSATTWTIAPMTSSYNSAVNITADGISMQDGADIKIGDKKLGEVLSEIQERLAILVPDPRLEEQFGELKQLREQYQKVLTDCKEKSKMWDILKKADK